MGATLFYYYFFFIIIFFLASSSLIHELSLEGPYTGFLPSDEALNLLSTNSLNKLYKDDNKMSEFVLNHFTKGLWMYRDLYGSSYQPVSKRNLLKKLFPCNTIYIFI